MFSKKIKIIHFSDVDTKPKPGYLSNAEVAKKHQVYAYTYHVIMCFVSITTYIFLYDLFCR